jgi:hypothetical protein
MPDTRVYNTPMPNNIGKQTKRSPESYNTPMPNNIGKRSTNSHNNRTRKKSQPRSVAIERPFQNDIDETSPLDYKSDMEDKLIYVFLRKNKDLIHKMIKSGDSSVSFGNNTDLKKRYESLDVIGKYFMSINIKNSLVNLLRKNLKTLTSMPMPTDEQDLESQYNQEVAMVEYIKVEIIKNLQSK